MVLDDEPSDSTTIIKKILSAKLFGDESGDGWKRNIRDIDGEILCGMSLALALVPVPPGQDHIHSRLSSLTLHPPSPIPHPSSLSYAIDNPKNRAWRVM